MVSSASRTTSPAVSSYAAMALLTAVFAWLAFFWWFSLEALLADGLCGARYGGPGCAPGTGWRIAVLVFATPLLMVATSVCNSEVYRPERRGHEWFRVVLFSVPVVALFHVLRGADLGFRSLTGAALCGAAAVAVVVWTARTTGVRGAFWLMRPERLSALGVDPSSRSLSLPQNIAFLVVNIAGGLAGFWAAHAAHGFLA
ncbi:hypothetical protein ACPEIF_05490 [Streptomyces sp. NPDC012600]|uniref:Transmembrane protein n=2 Tax=Streptomycetaceae TaxID=2062 RepID=A0ABU2W6J5_9ACTN|nr:hypothetical protein [Streptomyces griseus]MDT0493476.1 hypothetical protein [Streptomyces griseus]